MIAERDLVVLESASQSASECEVCGSEIEAGQGLTVRYLDRTIRFKCAGCLNRFRADPTQFFAGAESACCRGLHAVTSPASEWSCDRA